MNNERLQDRYTGAAARKYDEKRKSSPRFRAEEDAFALYFQKVSPKFVIDCPFGTGRWLDYYKQIDGRIIAVDLSDDMLFAAKQKMDKATAAKIEFIVASAFDYDFDQYSAEPPDLLVCTRFLNWVDSSRAQAAIANLSASGAKSAIIGASVRPSRCSFYRRLRMKFRLFRENLARRRSAQAIQHVHDEEFILRSFRDAGWEILDAKHIFSSPTRENYFWLLRRLDSDA